MENAAKKVTPKDLSDLDLYKLWHEKITLISKAENVARQASEEAKILHAEIEERKKPKPQPTEKEEPIEKEEPKSQKATSTKRGRKQA